MREKLYAMVHLLVEKSLQGPNVLNDEREITSYLTNRGFSQEEVYDVLSWLQHIPADREEEAETLTQSRRGRAIRVLHPEEHLAFTPAAQGIVHRLYNSGLIDDYLREEILQRCIDLTEEEIGLEEVKTVALLVFLKERREALSEALLKAFEEDKVRLTD